MNEQEQRAAVVAEARSWQRTPYHHMGRLKGHGVDCAQLPALVYHAVGLIPLVPLSYYPMDWHLHQAGERYLNTVLEYAHEVETPQPGDFVLWRVGRCLAHGAIILDWPTIVHAVKGVGVMLDDGNVGAIGNVSLDRRERHFYSLWGRPE